MTSVNKITPREWQSAAFRGITDAFDRTGAVLVVAPPAAGKTHVLGMLLGARQTDRVLVVVPTRETAWQCQSALMSFGIESGVLTAGEPEQRQHRVQIGTVQTITARLARKGAGWLPSADLIAFDEAHHCAAKTWAALAKRYASARRLGMTASPWRLDGKPLAEYFGEIVLGAQPSELVSAGIIARPDIFTQDHGLQQIEHTSDIGEKLKREAAHRIIVGDVYQHWLAHAPETQTVHFAPTREFSRRMVAQFKAAGFRAEHIEGSIPQKRRDEILAQFESGEIMLLSTVGLINEGWDMPSAVTMICTRPTGSLTLWLQQCGRVMRPGGRRVILDHAGNAVRLGHPCMDGRPWKLTERVGKERTSPGERLLECEKCKLRYEAKHEACPGCGHKPEPKTRAEMEHRAGVLVPLREMSDEELWTLLNDRYMTRREAARLFRQMRGFDHPKWVEHKDSLPREQSLRMKKRLSSLSLSQKRERMRPALAALTPELRTEAGRRGIRSLTEKQKAKGLSSFSVKFSSAIRSQWASAGNAMRRAPGLESLNSESRRMDMTRKQLGRWLRTAGIDTSRGVLPADVDRVVAEHGAKKPGE